MEEDKEVVLISSNNGKILANVEELLEENNIPFFVDDGFSARQTKGLINKKIKVNSSDYIKAKKLIDENEEYISGKVKAKIINPPIELQNLDEEYFNEIDEKLEKRNNNSKKISKIIVLLSAAIIVGIIIMAINL